MSIDVSFEENVVVGDLKAHGGKALLLPSTHIVSRVVRGAFQEHGLDWKFSVLYEVFVLSKMFYLSEDNLRDSNPA